MEIQKIDCLVKSTYLCPYCASSVVSGYGYCPDCGMRLNRQDTPGWKWAVICDCGYQNDIWYKYCVECGKKINIQRGC